MNKRTKITLFAAVGFVALGTMALGTAYADALLSHYPGARRLDVEQFDLSRLRHGWIEREATYHTGAEIMEVGQWYLALLEVGQDDEVHNAADCVSLRTVRQVLTFQRTVYVMLCPAAYGTRIALRDTLFLSP